MARLFRRWATGGASAPLRAALWMVIACFGFATMWALARVAGGHTHPFMVVFLRFVFGSIFMLPWLLSVGHLGLKSERRGLHVANATFQVLATFAMFYGVTAIPMAEVAALSFTSPLFATAGAALLLGERVGVRRWSATVVGFAGTLLILRPGADLDFISLPALIVLGGAACAAGGNLCTKALSRTEPPNIIVVNLSIMMALMSFPAAFAVWVPPSLTVLAVVAGAGAMGTFGLLMAARAYRLADASAVMPFRFSQLVFVALYGFAAFGEEPHAMTWLGGAIIFAATLYPARRESIRAREAAAKATPAAPGIARTASPSDQPEAARDGGAVGR